MPSKVVGVFSFEVRITLILFSGINMVQRCNGMRTSDMIRIYIL